VRTPTAPPGEIAVTEDPTSSDDAADRFVDHFAPIFCETDEDERILEQLATKVKRFEDTDGAVRLAIEGEYDVRDGFFTAPFEGEADDGVPDSFATLAGHHNGVMVETGGGGGLGFGGLREDGDLSAVSWNPTCLDRSGNEE
jgi:hypothetical protein